MSTEPAPFEVRDDVVLPIPHHLLSADGPQARGDVEPAEGLGLRATMATGIVERQAPMKIAREDFVAQMEAHGFRLAKEHTFLPYQYFLMFEVK